MNKSMLILALLATSSAAFAAEQLAPPAYQAPPPPAPAMPAPKYSNFELANTSAQWPMQVVYQVDNKNLELMTLKPVGKPGGYDNALTTRFTNHIMVAILDPAGRYYKGIAILRNHANLGQIYFLRTQMDKGVAAGPQDILVNVNTQRPKLPGVPLTKNIQVRQLQPTIAEGIDAVVPHIQALGIEDITVANFTNGEKDQLIRMLVGELEEGEAVPTLVQAVKIANEGLAEVRAAAAAGEPEEEEEEELTAEEVAAALREAEAAREAAGFTAEEGGRPLLRRERRRQQR